jgi:hypothetical protein
MPSSPTSRKAHLHEHSAFTDQTPWDQKPPRSPPRVLRGHGGIGRLRWRGALLLATKLLTVAFALRGCARFLWSRYAISHQHAPGDSLWFPNNPWPCQGSECPTLVAAVASVRRLHFQSVRSLFVVLSLPTPATPHRFRRNGLCPGHRRVEHHSTCAVGGACGLGARPCGRAFQVTFPPCSAFSEVLGFW